MTRVLAVCGKGGVGKTAFSAMLTRVLLEGREAGRLLVIDADPALGLAQALGVEIRRTVGQVREAIIAAARSDPSDEELAGMAGRLDYMLMEALVESDGRDRRSGEDHRGGDRRSGRDRLGGAGRGDSVFLAMGRSESLGCFCPVNSILREAIKVLSGQFETIVIDGEAGLEQINRQVIDDLDHLIIVTDTSARGLQTAALLKRLADDERAIHCRRAGIVFNRAEDGEVFRAEARAAAAKIGVEVLGFVPEDPMVASYDRAGRPLSELPLDSAALSAVRALALKLG